MAFNQKIARLAQDIIDALTLEGVLVATAYDASSDLYLTVTDPSAIGVNALIKLVKSAQLGNNQANPVTGLVEEVFTPHIIQLGYGSAAAASSTETIGANLTAGDKVTIAGHDFTSVDSGAAGDQWNITGTLASGTATVTVGITAGDAQNAANVLTINGHGFTAMNSGAAGDQFNLSGMAASGTATVGADLTAGDKVTIDGHDFTSVDSGAAGDQWNITGTQASATLTVGANLTAGEAPEVNGVPFTAVNSGAAGNQWNITGVQATGWTLLNTVIVGNQVVINGATFTAIAGATDTANNFHVGVSDALTAIELRDAINTSVDPLIAGLITAAINGGTPEQVDLTAVNKGTSGNAFTLGGAPTSATFSFSDGTPGASGLFGIGVGTTLGSVNTTACATSLAAAITGGSAVASAVGAIAVVTVTALLKGTSGNAITLTSSTNIIRSAATLSGGAVTTTACATSLAAAITGSVTVGITGVWTAASGGTAVVTITSVAIGTLKNGTTLASTGGATHLLVSGATISGGAVNLVNTATNAAAAIAGSITVGITGVVTAAAGLAGAINLSGVKKGTSGNVTLAQTGTGFSLSGATLTGGAVNTTACAASLATEISNSATVGIAGVVTATSALAVVTITAVAGGTGGNAITTTSTGAITSANGTLIGGSNTGTSTLVRYKTLAESILRGTQVEVYEKASAIAIGDVGVAANLVFTYRNTQYGNLAHI